MIILLFVSVVLETVGFLEGKRFVLMETMKPGTLLEIAHENNTTRR